MRSTMPFGKATLSRTQAASLGSCASARPATAFIATTPLCGTLSQESTVNGATPAARRARSAARIRPKTVFGASGLAASAAIAGMAGSKAPVAGSMK